jgi:hypothetical protein
MFIHAFRSAAIRFKSDFRESRHACMVKHLLRMPFDPSSVARCGKQICDRNPVDMVDCVYVGVVGLPSLDESKK